MIGHLRAFAQLAADVEAGAVREHQVEQDEIGVAPGELERLCDRSGHLRLEALAFGGPRPVAR